MVHRAMLLSALAVSGLAVVPVGNAQEASTTTGPAAATATAAAATTAAPSDLPARRVVRDRETGRLRAPTAEEAADMDAQERSQRAARAASPVGSQTRVRQHANGMRSAVVGLEHLVSIQARRGADGKLIVEHANPAHDHPAVARDHQPTE